MGNIQVIRIATTTFNLSVISKNIVFWQKNQNIENQFLRVILLRSKQTKYFSSNWTRVDKRLLFWNFSKRIYSIVTTGIKFAADVIATATDYR